LASTPYSLLVISCHTLARVSRFSGRDFTRAEVFPELLVRHMGKLIDLFVGGLRLACEQDLCALQYRNREPPAGVTPAQVPSTNCEGTWHEIPHLVSVARQDRLHFSLREDAGYCVASEARIAPDLAIALAGQRCCDYPHLRRFGRPQT